MTVTLFDGRLLKVASQFFLVRILSEMTLFPNGMVDTVTMCWLQILNTEVNRWFTYDLQSGYLPIYVVCISLEIVPSMS